MVAIKNKDAHFPFLIVLISDEPSPVYVSYMDFLEVFGHANASEV